MNNEAELTKQNPVNFEVERKMSQYEFTEEINGKIIVFTSIENKKDRSISFYALEVNKANLHLSNPKDSGAFLRTGKKGL